MVGFEPSLNTISDSTGNCRKCGESGIFTKLHAREHINNSPDCKAYFEGKPRPSKNSLDVISASELATKDFPQEQWLVEKLLPKKGVIFWGGKRGSMKTWSAMILALSIARGMKYLDNFETVKADVLFVDAENGGAQMQKRLKMLTRTTEIPSNLHFSFFPKLKFDEDTTPLEEFLEEHPGAVVIVDSFRRVLGVDENEAGEVNTLFVDAIRPLIEAYDATFILLHHLRKGMGKGVHDHLDELRGSSELVNYADAVILFERVRSDGRALIMRHAKSRTGIEQEPCRLEVEADEDTFRFNFLGTFEESANQPEKAAKAIQKWVFENAKTEFKTSEVQDALKTEFNGKAIGRGLKWLVEQNLFTKPRKGVYAPISGTLADFGTNGQTGQTHEESGEDGE